MDTNVHDLETAEAVAVTVTVIAIEGEEKIEEEIEEIGDNRRN